MALTTEERMAAIRRFLRRRRPPDVAKADVIAAAQAMDEWLDANAASFNSALADPFKGVATTQQKYLLLLYILLKRMGEL